MARNRKRTKAATILRRLDASARDGDDTRKAELLDEKRRFEAGSLTAPFAGHTSIGVVHPGSREIDTMWRGSETPSMHTNARD